MKEQRRIWPFLTFAGAIILLCILLLLFLPDMGGTLINTVPEFPPESSDFVGSSAESLTRLTITKENVKAVIAEMERPEEYFSETESVLSHASGSGSFLRRKWVKGKFSRIDIINPGQTSASLHYILTEKDAYIWRSYDKTPLKLGRGELSADDLQMLMSYEDILNAETENITTAQHTKYDGIDCIYAEVKDPSLGYSERYWVSSSSGLLVYGQTLDENGAVIYTVSVKQTETAPQDKELFRLPDGSLPDGLNQEEPAPVSLNPESNSEG